MKINQLLKFEPILKEKIWGGDKLKSHLNKKISKSGIGESWEISDIEDNISVVSNGELKGKTLKELINTYKSDLLGAKVYKRFGDNFPLLIKFIDAKKALSIQLHPNDEFARERHNSFGKTEMWYVLQADKFSNLIIGFKNNSHKEEYLHHLENKSLLSILNTEDIKKGDAYFIPTGTIHAIGAGVLLAEIQQTSDITYRIYDWDRPNVDGTHRELHTEEAIDTIDYNTKKSYKALYSREQNVSNKIVSCPYFTTNTLFVSVNLSFDITKKDSFVIYMCLDGEASFLIKNGKETLKKGETILVPACLKKFSIHPKKKTELLEIFIE